MIAELRSLEDADGNLHTRDVVERARNPSSALHDHPAFEWDVTRAAYKQWMDAARNVVQIYVGLVDDGGDRKPMRLMVHMVDVNKKPIYRPTQKMIRENRAALVTSVCNSILSAIKSYPLSEFDHVVELVEEIRDTANAPKPRARKQRRQQQKGGRHQPTV